ncbi:DUF1801 domain-containing protein [Planctomycetes bacterium K23_9]|uniref:YdhG-like domain-containing protein n=1 Tax=Stieleria marina TaxID=1930275 RepID=A0A517NMK5_9BACT|nr:hypothetical protein K239x_02920 [Planctomycetes bacterium K23_9]
MQSKAATVAQYLRELPDERRAAIKAVRKTIRQHLPDGYKEGMQYGMIGYYVPHKLYSAGYHCDPSQPLPFAHLASQKNHMAIYLFGMYADAKIEKWFRQQWEKTGKRLDMGKSCIRFRKLDDLPLELIGQSIGKIPVEHLIRQYEASVDPARRKAPQKRAKNIAAKKTRTKKRSAKKP